MKEKQLDSETLESWVQEVLELFRAGKQMRGDNRYDLEHHEWGYDQKKGDYYHRVQIAAPDSPDRVSYGEKAVREWLEHWLKLKGLKGLKKEQGW